MSKNIAIITARGGSKRIPRKNILEFCGKPIIAYSIESAINSKIFKEVMVSTDDMEIAKIAKSFGANVPFYRSEKTSNDFATTTDVIEEVLLEYQKIGQNFDFVCCIYPTAPFITDEKLKKSFDLIKEKNADSVIPVTKYSYPIQRALKIENGILEMIYPENLDKRSQDLTTAYHDVGQFYWLNVNKFLKTGEFFSKSTVPIEIPESEVQDIDNVEDWKMAEIKYKVMRNKGKDE
ncbi:MAG: pseudaminic acid cytidylyltransferase [Candidatus Gastranaerophilaceae bacterium]|jgi:N-acylneuraminate cytidylyltransferase